MHVRQPRCDEQASMEMEDRGGGDPKHSSSSSSMSGGRRLAWAVILTQLLAVLVASTGVSTQALTRQGVYAPTAQAFLVYAALALVFGGWHLLLPLVQRRSASRTADGASSTGAARARTWAWLRRAWPSVALLALVDVEANVLVTKAYQYTSLTSVTLLDCFTIPVVTLLSWLLLRARYRPGHYAGAAACIAGLALLVLGDAQPGAQGSSTSSGSAPLLGDALVLAGAALYAVCNVAQELLLSEAGLAPGQLLALLGVFGAVVSGLQAAALEHSALAGVCWSCPAVLLPLGGFAGAMLVFYSLVPQVLLMGGATLLNLGLLSSDGWAALARQLWFGGFQGWSAVFFVASLLLVAAGLLVFTLSGSPKPATHGGDSGQSGGCAEPTAAAAAAAGNGVVYARLQSAECDVQQQAGGSHAQQQQQLPTDKQSAV